MPTMYTVISISQFLLVNVQGGVSENCILPPAEWHTGGQLQHKAGMACCPHWSCSCCILSHCSHWRWHKVWMSCCPHWRWHKVWMACCPHWRWHKVWMSCCPHWRWHKVWMACCPHWRWHKVWMSCCPHWRWHKVWMACCPHWRWHKVQMTLVFCFYFTFRLMRLPIAITLDRNVKCQSCLPVSGVKFEKYGEYSGSEDDRAISSNPKNKDMQHPIYISNIDHNIPTNNLLYYHHLSTG